MSLLYFSAVVEIKSNKIVYTAVSYEGVQPRREYIDRKLYQESHFAIDLKIGDRIELTIPYGCVKVWSLKKQSENESN